MTVQDEIQGWERAVLTSLGYYRGEALPGFPYRYGEWVPVDARYSAMLSWRYASRVPR